MQPPRRCTTQHRPPTLGVPRNSLAGADLRVRDPMSAAAVGDPDPNPPLSPHNTYGLVGKSSSRDNAISDVSGLRGVDRLE